MLHVGLTRITKKNLLPSLKGTFSNDDALYPTSHCDGHRKGASTLTLLARSRWIAVCTFNEGFLSVWPSLTCALVTGYQWLTWHFDFLFASTGANKNLEGRWFKNPHYLVRVLSNISVMCTRYFATVLSFGVAGWFGMLCQNKAICTSDGIFLNILWACSLDSACSRTMNMK